MARGRDARPGKAALAAALVAHLVLGVLWLALYASAVVLGSGSSRADDLVFVLAGVCWLVAIRAIVAGWRSGSRWFWAVPLAWAIVFATATVAAA